MGSPSNAKASDARVYLNIEVIRNTTARGLCAWMHVMWVLVPAGIVLQLVQEEAGSDQWTIARPPTLHHVNIASSALAVACCTVTCTALTRNVWLLHRSSRTWSKTQWRLLRQRALTFAFFGLASFFTLATNAAALADACEYADSTTSIGRYAYPLRLLLETCVIGLFVVDARSLRWVRPRATHAPIFSWLLSPSSSPFSSKNRGYDALSFAPLSRGLHSMHLGPQHPKADSSAAATETEAVPRARRALQRLGSRLAGGVADELPAEATHPVPRAHSERLPQVLVLRGGCSMRTDHSIDQAHVTDGVLDNALQNAARNQSDSTDVVNVTSEPVGRVLTAQSAELTSDVRDSRDTAVLRSHERVRCDAVMSSGCDAALEAQTSRSSVALSSAGPSVLPVPSGEPAESAWNAKNEAFAAVQPLISAPERALWWAWDVWVLIVTCAVMYVCFMITHVSQIDFVDLVGGKITSCTKTGTCDCAWYNAQCADVDSEGFNIDVTFGVAFVIQAWFTVLYYWELLNAYRSRRKQLSSSFTYSNMLLNLELRFGAIYIGLTIVKGALTVAPATLRGGTETELADALGLNAADFDAVADDAIQLQQLEALRTAQLEEAQQVVHYCLTHICNRFGNFAFTAAFTVIMLLRVLIVWPLAPKAAHGMPHKLEQAFVWGEADMRDSPRAVKDKAVFSYERALKCLVWSQLAYCYTEEDGLRHATALLTQCLHDNEDPWDGAMRLFGLTKSIVFLEVSLETKVVVAWGPTAMLVAFRGTAATVNMRKDLQCNVVPLRGSHHDLNEMEQLKTRVKCTGVGASVLVHKGFVATYEAGGVGQRVVDHLLCLLDSGAVSRDTVTLHVTGHSLGGALAQLSALDMAAQCGLHSHQVSVYTFGAPRVGNAAFVEYYNPLVPNTWHVINDQDLVAKIPKGSTTVNRYKRTGRRVVINASGGFFVDPTFLQFSLLQRWWASNAADHGLARYMLALAAALRVHMHMSRDDASREAMTRLLRACPAVGRLLRLSCLPKKRLSQLTRCRDASTTGGSELEMSSVRETRV